MITSRGVVEHDPKTLSMLVFDDSEAVRSVQLYGVDPYYVGEAVRILAGDHGVGHVDLNFGCPVPKVTRKGGGAALPYKRGLLDRILRAAVAGAEPYGIPVTMKTRKGIDDENLTYLDAGRIAEDAGCAAIALHGRTAAQHYSGSADWGSIARLKSHVSIPVLGNGDIWEAFDALRMMRQTGCDGVVVGRGCLGRPWLFRELAEVFDGREPADPPRLGDVLAILREHGALLVDFFGERKGVLELRKWCGWYTKGFAGSAQVRAALQRIETLDEMDSWLDELDGSQAFPRAALRVSRAKRGGAQDKVSLPPGWLDLGERERARVGERAATGAATGAATAGVASGAPTEEDALPSEICGESR
jgi:nifR3 family TIM-barrel protein